jgi:hypothetical protein
MDIASLIVVLHIDAGTAATTLKLMQGQTGVDTVWSTEQAHTHAVHGRYSVFEGWCALLEGSGLIFDIGPNIVLVRPEEYRGERNAECQDKPNGFGPGFVHPPVADWK